MLALLRIVVHLIGLDIALFSNILSFYIWSSIDFWRAENLITQRPRYRFYTVITIYNERIYPNTHTPLFWHPYDVVLTLWTLYGHRNDVVCLLGLDVYVFALDFTGISSVVNEYGPNKLLVQILTSKAVSCFSWLLMTETTPRTSSRRWFRSTAQKYGREHTLLFKEVP